MHPYGPLPLTFALFFRRNLFVDLGSQRSPLPPPSATASYIITHALSAVYDPISANSGVCAAIIRRFPSNRTRVITRVIQTSKAREQGNKERIRQEPYQVQCRYSAGTVRGRCKRFPLCTATINTIIDRRTVRQFVSSIFLRTSSAHEKTAQITCFHRSWSQSRQ